MQVEGREHEVLLGLVDSGSSKTLVKKSATQGTKDMKMSQSKPAKWKTKAGMFKTQHTANLENAKLPQFTKHKELDMNKVHVCDDPDEKCNFILGREVCQSV